MKEVLAVNHISAVIVPSAASIVFASTELGLGASRDCTRNLA